MNKWIKLLIVFSVLVFLLGCGNMQIEHPFQTYHDPVVPYPSATSGWISHPGGGAQDHPLGAELPPGNYDY